LWKLRGIRISSLRKGDPRRAHLCGERVRFRASPVDTFDLLMLSNTNGISIACGVFKWAPPAFPSRIGTGKPARGQAPPSLRSSLVYVLADDRADQHVESTAMPRMRLAVHRDDAIGLSADDGLDALLQSRIVQIENLAAR